MNIHHPKYKKRIYHEYWKEISELKRNLDCTQQINQWELDYTVIKQRGIKRKFGTPILLRYYHEHGKRKILQNSQRSKRRK